MNKLSFVGILALLVSMLSGCSIANILRMKSANDDIQPQLPVTSTDHYQQNMQAFYIGEKPYIKVTANAQEELLFLIDTGASFTMMFDTKKVSRLQFERGFSLELRGWGDGENTPAYQTKLDSLSFGGVSFSEVNVAYIPVSTTQYYLSPDEAIFDGVLGHDLLRHFNWMYDKQAGFISLSNTAYAKHSSDVQLPIDVSFSKLNIPVTMHMDNREFEHEVVVDTGSRHYFKFSSAFIENNDIAMPYPLIQASDFGLSGEARHQRFRLPALSLGEIELQGIKANIIKADDEDDFWVIGSALMNQFVTIIDYQNNIMTFRPYEKPAFETQYNLAGLDLRKLTNGNLMVRYVYPHLPAHQRGFLAGAVVTSINGVSATSLTEEDWLEMAALPDTFHFCFVQKPCVELTTQHIPGYSIAGSLVAGTSVATSVAH